MNKIGNVSMNYDFYNGSDDYSDGDIENELLQYVENNDDVMEILRSENRWPILYHLSPVRQNIVQWYDFKGNSSVLEIGAGCGAISGALCKKAKKVTAVELSKRRALINANRNKECDNLNIIVGNFNDIKFAEKYDYITLIGVLEYADYFTSGNNSFVDFMKNIKQLLKKDGKLLIAIENKYGMKYFAGQVEDHTGRLFDGIEGYIGTNSKVRTFSKDELANMVGKAGFEKMNFFYPFPDYKFPVQIFSDKYLPKAEDVVCSLESYDNDRIRFFDETAAFSQVIDAGKFDFFSNSFFVEAINDQQEIKENEKVYSKITKDRKKEYQIETSIYFNNKEDKYIASKCALSKDSIEHINKMSNRYEDFKKIEKHLSAQLCECVNDNGKLYFEFVKGKSICDKLLDALKDNKKEEFDKLLFEYQNMVFDSIENENKDKVKGLNIDLTFDNIIEVSNGQYKIIDYEWCLEEELPVKYAFYRAVYAFYMRYHDTVSKVYSLRELLLFFSISPEEEKEYEKMNQQFVNKVYDNVSGYNAILSKYKKISEKFENRVLYHDYFAQLFIDDGSGYNEENSLKVPITVLKDYQDIVFDISKKNVTRLRFDPINLPAIVKIKEIYGQDINGNKISIKVLSDNSIVTSIYSYMFENTDPQMELEYTGGIEKIVINMKISLTRFEEFNDLMRLSDLRIYKEYTKEKELLENIFSTLENHRNILPDIDKYFNVTKKLVGVQEKKADNEKNLVCLSPTFKEETSIFINEIINLAYLRQDMEKELKEVINDRDRLTRELEYIKGTKIYKGFLEKKVAKENFE